MRKARLEHEQMLKDEDARKAAEDPNYKPKFKQQEPDEPADAKPDLKKRLEEERRKHR